MKSVSQILFLCRQLEVPAAWGPTKPVFSGGAMGEVFHLVKNAARATFFREAGAKAQFRHAPQIALVEPGRS
jgi:hypothetical protein